MRSDEVRTSENFTKYLKFINSYEDGKYIAYEFSDESGNPAIHYQLNPELIEDKKAKGMARLWNTKISKLKIGDICLAICKCREVLEPGYSRSEFYLNVDRILKPLTRIKLVTKTYRGMPTEFAVEENITDWEMIK